ncbi:MAG: hypothetical protein ACP5QK_02570 [Myxococcota bacterium]
MSTENKEKFDLLLSSIKNDFTNENLHNVIIDFCIDNNLEMELINFYKTNTEKFPDICNKMLERLADRSIARLYNTKIKKKTDDESKKTAIKLILILIATIIAMFFIWRALLSSFNRQFLQ